MTKMQTLRPGLLVSLKTSVRGNVNYAKEVIAANTVDEKTKTAKETWQTTRTVADAEEHTKAREARSKAQGLIRKVCAHSAFGLLCPELDRDKLEAAIAEARKIAEEFNATSNLTTITVYAMVGRIAADDVEAVKAINSEISDLMATMQEGIANCDVKIIRDAAAKARELGAMLSPEAEGRSRAAIELAREVAKKLVKAGEAGAKEVDRSAIAKLAEYRTSFLDIGDAAPVAAPQADARALDLAPESARGDIGYTVPKARAAEV